MGIFYKLARGRLYFELEPGAKGQKIAAATDSYRRGGEMRRLAAAWAVKGEGKTMPLDLLVSLGTVETL